MPDHEGGWSTSEARRSGLRVRDTPLLIGARTGEERPRSAVLHTPGPWSPRLIALAPLMEAALRWLADHTPATAELLRLMDATPIPCGQSVITARRSDLAGWAGY